MDDRAMPILCIRCRTPRGKTRWMDQPFGVALEFPEKGVRWFDCCDCSFVLFDDVKINEIEKNGFNLQDMSYLCMAGFERQSAMTSRGVGMSSIHRDVYTPG